LTPWTVCKNKHTRDTQEKSTDTARAQKKLQASKTKLASKYPDIIQKDKKGKHALLSEVHYTSHSPARTRVLLQAENSAVPFNCINRKTNTIS
jgi:hypothetical protein